MPDPVTVDEDALEEKDGETLGPVSPTSSGSTVRENPAGDPTKMEKMAHMYRQTARRDSTGSALQTMPDEPPPLSGTITAPAH